jgi:predicted acylesterase/phospholipase RssA
MEDLGLDARAADVIVGTSAGALVAASLRRYPPARPQPAAQARDGLASRNAVDRRGPPAGRSPSRLRQPRRPVADIGSAVAASCAIPAYFTPIQIDGVDYIDGGVHSPTCWQARTWIWSW